MANRRALEDLKKKYAEKLKVLVEFCFLRSKYIKKKTGQIRVSIEYTNIRGMKLKNWLFRWRSVHDQIGLFSKETVFYVKQMDCRGYLEIEVFPRKEEKQFESDPRLLDNFKKECSTKIIFAELVWESFQSVLDAREKGVSLNDNTPCYAQHELNIFAEKFDIQMKLTFILQERQLVRDGDM